MPVKTTAYKNITIFVCKLKFKVANLNRFFLLLSLTSVIFFMSESICHAQYSKKKREREAIRMGIKLSGGTVMAREETVYIGSGKDQIVHEIQLSQGLPQYNAGFWAQKRFGWLYSELNILYTYYGMAFDVTTYKEEGRPKKRMIERFGYLDLQAMGGLYSNNFRLGVGPVMHILTNQKSQLLGLENYNQKLRYVSYGFSFAVGYDLGRFSIDLKYDKAFRTIGDHIYYRFSKSQFFETPDGLTFSIAYSFADEP